MKPSRQWQIIASSLCVIAIAGAPTALRADAPILASGNGFVAMPPRQPPRTGPARILLDAPIPAQPWTHPTRVRSLPGSIATVPLALADGSIVVGLRSPASLAWIDPSGSTQTIVALDDRPTGELALGSDGRVFVGAENHYVYAVAPDGSVRGQLKIDTTPVRGPVTNEDGSIFVVSNPSGGTAEIATMSPTGTVLSRRTLPQHVLDLALGGDGCLWILHAGGLACMTTSGTLNEASFGHGASRIYSVRDDVLAAITGTEIQFRTTRGVARGHLDLGTAILWATPLPGGNIAVSRSGPPQELWIVASDGSVTARLPSPAASSSRVLGIVADSTGAMATVTTDGLITAIEPDGTTRWSMILPDAIAQAPIPLRGGGMVVVLASGGAILVR